MSWIWSKSRVRAYAESEKGTDGYFHEAQTHSGTGTSMDVPHCMMCS